MKLRKRYGPVKEGIRARLRCEAGQKSLEELEKLRAETDMLLRQMQAKIDANGAVKKRKDD